MTLIWDFRESTVDVEQSSFSVKVRCHTGYIIAHTSPCPSLPETGTKAAPLTSKQ
ncbi:hypothetical protein J6590_055885 [Homalodisca vitripennis]|nr:hypothetical protein J6590_055885 [Homalodisca vitripennis]